MTFMKWAATAAVVAVTALVSGCGSGGSGSDASVRLINASVGYASLSMTVNNNAVGTAVAYGSASNYSTQDVSQTVTISNGATGSTLLQPTLSSTQCGARCSVIAYGWADATLQRLTLQENQDQPAAGKTRLNIQNLAPDAGSLDIYVDSSSSTPGTTKISSGLLGGYGTGFYDYDAGTYTVTITGANDVSDVRMQISNVSLPALQVATLILTAGSGGTTAATSTVTGGALVNGILAIQGGALSTFSSSTARVRIVSTMPGTATTISATRGSSTLLSQQVGQYKGKYITVNSGSAAVSVVVNGAPINLTPTLQAGGDYTLMVWGMPASPSVAVIPDDNRLPTSSSTGKIRLYNGLANASGAGLTLTLNFANYASNVLPGTVSEPDFPPASATNQPYPAVVTSTAFPGVNLLTLPQPTGNYVSITAGNIYELFMAGDGSTAAGVTTMFECLRGSSGTCQ